MKQRILFLLISYYVVTFSVFADDYHYLTVSSSPTSSKTVTVRARSMGDSYYLLGTLAPGGQIIYPNKNFRSYSGDYAQYNINIDGEDVQIGAYPWRIPGQTIGDGGRDYFIVYVPPSGPPSYTTNAYYLGVGFSNPTKYSVLVLLTDPSGSFLLPPVPLESGSESSVFIAVKGSDDYPDISLIPTFTLFADIYSGSADSRVLVSRSVKGGSVTYSSWGLTPESASVVWLDVPSPFGNNFDLVSNTNGFYTNAINWNVNSNLSGAVTEGTAKTSAEVAHQDAMNNSIVIGAVGSNIVSAIHGNASILTNIASDVLAIRNKTNVGSGGTNIITVVGSGTNSDFGVHTRLDSISGVLTNQSASVGGLGDGTNFNRLGFGSGISNAVGAIGGALSQDGVGVPSLENNIPGDDIVFELPGGKKLFLGFIHLPASVLDSVSIIRNALAWIICFLLLYNTVRWGQSCVIEVMNGRQIQGSGQSIVGTNARVVTATAYAAIISGIVISIPSFVLAFMSTHSGYVNTGDYSTLTSSTVWSISTAFIPWAVLTQALTTWILYRYVVGFTMLVAWKSIILALLA